MKDSDQKVFVSLKTNQTVQVNGDIELLTKDNTAEIVKGNLAVRYEVEDEGNTEELLTNLLDQQPIDKKIVLDTERDTLLAGALGAAFLNNNIDQIVEYAYYQDEAAFDVAYANLINKVIRAYDILDLEVDSSLANTRMGKKTIQQSIILVDQLIAKMNTRYYIEPVYTTRLQSVLTWLMLFQQDPFVQLEQQEGASFAEIMQLLEEAGYSTAGLTIY